MAVKRTSVFRPGNTCSYTVCSVMNKSVKWVHGQLNRADRWLSIKMSLTAICLSIHTQLIHMQSLLYIFLTRLEDTERARLTLFIKYSLYKMMHERYQKIHKSNSAIIASMGRYSRLDIVDLNETAFYTIITKSIFCMPRAPALIHRKETWLLFAVSLSNKSLESRLNTNLHYWMQDSGVCRLQSFTGSKQPYAMFGNNQRQAYVVGYNACSAIWT